MRILGTMLMLLGAFAMVAAVLAVVGPSLRANGIDIIGDVTSVPGAFIGGAVFLVAGAWLRRRRPTRVPDRP